MGLWGCPQKCESAPSGFPERAAIFSVSLIRFSGTGPRAYGLDPQGARSVNRNPQT